MSNIGAVCRQQGNFQAVGLQDVVLFEYLIILSGCKVNCSWLLSSVEPCATLLPNWSCFFECCWCWIEIQFAPAKVGAAVSTTPRRFSRKNVAATSKRTIPCSPSNVDMVLLTPPSKPSIIITIIINEPSLFNYCNESCCYHYYYHFHQPLHSRKRRISLPGGGRLVSSGVTLESQLRVWSPRLAMGNAHAVFWDGWLVTGLVSGHTYINIYI